MPSWNEPAVFILNICEKILHTVINKMNTYSKSRWVIDGMNLYRILFIGKSDPPPQIEALRDSPWEYPPLGGEWVLRTQVHLIFGSLSQ